MTLAAVAAVAAAPLPQAVAAAAPASKVSAAVERVREARRAQVQQQAGQGTPIAENVVEASEAHVFTYERADNFFAVVYRRRSSKRLHWLRFATQAARTRWIDDQLRIMADDKVRYGQPDDWKPSFVVGTILASTWGHEQTNVEFYEVVEVRGVATVVLRPILATKTGSAGLGDMGGTITPRPGEYEGQERLTLRVKSGGRSLGDYVRLESYKIACAWSGKPMRYTSYA